MTPHGHPLPPLPPVPLIPPASPAPAPDSGLGPLAAGPGPAPGPLASGLPFPPGFVWGAGTSAYQIEGAWDADGKGPSIWDEFCRRPGVVAGGDTGEVACDHYRRMAEDVALMGEIGLGAYRFSVSWPRVMPDAERLNGAGLDFYERLVDALLERGVQPWATLFHWDLPSWVHRRGGWMNRDSAAWFAEYAAEVASRLGDRVSKWITLNEPQVFIQYGHGDGRNAPGLRLSLHDQLLSCHHALLAHGLGAQAVRAEVAGRAKEGKGGVGWAPIGYAKVPETGGAADVEAARRSMFAVTRRDLWNAAWYSDPVCLGKYPEDGLALYGADVPAFPSSDLETIRQPLDFFGVNIYEGERVRACAPGPGGGGREFEEAPRPPGHPTTAIRWPVEPDALYWGPRFTFERYGVPIVVTENGLSMTDWVHVDGKVHDPQRIDFLTRYLRALRRAVSDGVDVRGYFHWSLMDNFEWAEGYRERFGLVHVDYATQTRTPKDSAAWYRGVIESNGGSLGREG